MSAAAEASTDPLAFIGRVRIYGWLDTIFIYGTVMLIPYDLPLVHQACVPLAMVGILLMLLEGDLGPFLHFLRKLPQLSLPVFITCVMAVIGLYANVEPILASHFQSENGWQRALAQFLILIISLAYPFYFAFRLLRRKDWVATITHAAWLSLPIPMLVGGLQAANRFGVPGLARLPYVGGTYETFDPSGAYTSGSFRLTSVAREASWFASYVCAVLPFLIRDIGRMARGWLRRGAVLIIALLLFEFFLGFSKSAYAAIALQALAAGLVVLIVKRPWRFMLRALFLVLMGATLLLALAGVSPATFSRVTQPFVTRAELTYLLFEPLLTGDTTYTSISTRFGMSEAGLAMGNDRPATGVGLGQFGFYANAYTPLYGLNPEVLVWLSNDTKAWPSTSNLYARLVAELGWFGFVAYMVFRLLLYGFFGLRVLRRDNPHWGRDLGIFSSLTALFVFDLHRDSFIDLDVWLILAMAMSCLAEKFTLPRAGMPALGWAPRRILAGTTICFCVAMGLTLTQPTTYQAVAVIEPKTGGLVVDDDGATGISINLLSGRTGNNFTLFRTYWASRAVAARIIARDPALARTVMGEKEKNITPETLASYITQNIAVLMSDNQTVLTYQYRHRDPSVADRFLTLAIRETDRAVAAAIADTDARARELSNLVTQQDGLDMSSRQIMLSRVVAQELQSSFDRAGPNVSFEFIEQPHVLGSPLPQPVFAVLFALILASFTAFLAVTARLWWRAGPVQPMTSR